MLSLSEKSGTPKRSLCKSKCHSCERSVGSVRWTRWLATNNVCIISLLIYAVIDAIDADVVVISATNQTVDVFIDFELGFAASLPSDGLKARIVSAYPEDACSPIESPPLSNDSSHKWVALIKRYPCDFQRKVRNAMDAKFDAAIIYNIDFSAVKYSSSHFPQIDNGITIPAVLLSYDDGLALKKEYLYDKGYYIMMMPETPFNLNAYLLPFAIVIGVCLLLMISFMVFQIVKCIRDRRRKQRHRLSSRHLKQIPIIKFKKGDQYDTCAICLEEYVEGEKLRLLPCGHAYHVKCIDPWLTKNRRVCPVCKGKVILPGMSDVSDTDSDPDNANNNGPNERTPLLSNDRNTNRGTRLRHRSYPQTSLASNEEHINSAHDIEERQPESEPILAESSSNSAPNVRLVEADITSNQLSINCDIDDQSVIEIANEATFADTSALFNGHKQVKNRRQDVIV